MVFQKQLYPKLDAKTIKSQMLTGMATHCHDLSFKHMQAVYMHVRNQKFCACKFTFISRHVSSDLTDWAFVHLIVGAHVLLGMDMDRAWLDTSHIGSLVRGTSLLSLKLFCGFRGAPSEQRQYVLVAHSGCRSATWPAPIPFTAINY